MSAKMTMVIDGIITGLNNLNEKVDDAVRVMATQGGQKMQNFARENRKWTDRTGQARQRLVGGSGLMPRGHGYRVYIAHGVDYGIWLELAHEKRFSILPQTVEYVGAFEILPGFEHLFERLSGL